MKNGAPRTRKVEWVKVHAMVGVKTNVVTAAKVLEKNTADSPQFAGLVKTTTEQFTIKEVSGDKAYAGRSNCATVEAIGGQFYPAFKKNATGAVGGAYGRAYHLFALNKDEYEKHYHKRSNVESTFSAVKRKFGEALRSKTDRAMRNETLAKLVAFNITCVIAAMFELGIAPMLGCTKNEPAAQVIRFPGA